MLTGEHSIVLIALPSKDAAFLSWTPFVQNARPPSGGGGAGAKPGLLIPDRGLYISFPACSFLMEEYEGQLTLLTVGLD